MKKLLTAFIFLPSFLFSQQDSSAVKPDTVIHHWHAGGTAGLNFAQASFTNWAGGGVNSLSGQALFSGCVSYKKDSTSWTNSLDLAYGILQQGFNGSVRKTDDKIDFTSLYGRYAFKKVWYYSALLGFKTQFSPGFNYYGDTAKTLISDVMSPAYTLLAIGLDYKPSDKFSLFMSPVTGRITFVESPTLADQGAFGVKKAETDSAGHITRHGEHVRYEFGGYVRIQYKAEVVKNVTVTGRCEFFSNYLKDPQDVDVNMQMLIGMKVNKHITVSLSMQAIYDNDITISVDKNHDGIVDDKGPRLQFSQILGVGVTTKF